MAVDPGSNCITLAEDSLSTMIAASPTFQAWVVAYDADHVPADHIHVDFVTLPGFVGNPSGPRNDVYTPEEIQALGRHALIGIDPGSGDVGYGHNATSSGYEHLPRGQIWCEFRQVFDTSTTDLSAASRQFKNMHGKTVEEVLSLANVDGNLSVLGASLVFHGPNAEDKYPGTFQELVAQWAFVYNSGD